MKRVVMSFMTMLLCLCIVICSGCGSKSSSTGNGANKASSSVQEMKKSESSDGIKGSSEAGKQDKANEEKSVDMNRKIIRNANLEIETKKYDECINNFNQEVNKCGGYLQSSNENGSRIMDENSASLRGATFVVRIPKDNFDKFLNEAGNLGNVIGKKISTEDVSAQYFDSEARIKALKVQEERLLELLKKSGDLKDVLAIEKELSDVRYQIENLTGTLNKIDKLVEYCTVTVDIRQVSEYVQPKPKTLGQKMQNAWILSFKSLGKVFDFIVIGATAVLPYAVIAAVLFFIVKMLRIRKKK